MILIKHAEVYSPEHIGVRDLLICGEKIELIGESIDIDQKYVTIINCTGKIATPGIIDQHVHVTGGGGEGGFSTRAPELRITEMIDSGITTVVGLLGTDASTRSVGNLIAKTKSINEQGFTAFCLTGSYEYPTVALTGSVRNDIVFLAEVIGCKVALSDHRSSHMTAEELTRLASDVKVAGMLSGKPQMLVVHMGEGRRGLQPLFDIVDESDLPIGLFRPTHLNRSRRLIAESFEFAKRGGYADYTCGLDLSEATRPSTVVERAKEGDVPLDKITFTSDGYGSFSTYDAAGKLEWIGIASLRAVFDELKYMVTEMGFELCDALPYMTTNVAAGLNLGDSKGRLEAGYDADVLLLNEDFEIETLIARGKVFKQDGRIAVRLPFE